MSTLSELSSSSATESEISKESYVPYKDKYTFEQRINKVNDFKKRFPTKIPVIIEKDPRSDIENISKNTYLFEKDIPYKRVLFIIRKGIKLSPEKGLFVFINNIMINDMDTTVEQLNEKYGEPDGLFIVYSGENVFG